MDILAARRRFFFEPKVLQRAAVASLTKATGVNALTSTVTGEGLKVSSSAGASAGQYHMRVARLASNQWLKSAAVLDREVPIGTGGHIELLHKSGNTTRVPFQIQWHQGARTPDNDGDHRRSKRSRYHPNKPTQAGWHCGTRASKPSTTDCFGFITLTLKDGRQISANPKRCFCCHPHRLAQGRVGVNRFRYVHNVGSHFNR